MKRSEYEAQINQEIFDRLLADKEKFQTVFKSIKGSDAVIEYNRYLHIALWIIEGYRDALIEFLKIDTF